MNSVRAWLLALPIQARWVFGGGVTLAGLVLVIIFLGNAGAIIANLSAISATKPSIARLIGHQEVESDLARLVQELDVRLANLAFGADLDNSQAGAQLQQLLRRFAEQSGLVVSASLLGPVDEEGAPEGFVALTVDLKMSGPPLGIDMFLDEIYEESPVLEVTQLTLFQPRRPRSRRGQPLTAAEREQLNITATVTGYKQR